MLDVAIHAELAAYDQPGFNDKWEAADRGADVAGDLITESQQLMATLASLIAAMGVVSVLHLLLLPLMVLAALPQGVASMKAARVHHATARAMSAERQVLYLLHWYMIDKRVADQLRAGILLRRYRVIGERVDAAIDKAVHQGARYWLIGAVAGGLASGLVWAARNSTSPQPAWRSRYPLYPRVLLVLTGATTARLQRRINDLRSPRRRPPPAHRRHQGRRCTAGQASVIAASTRCCSSRSSSSRPRRRRLPTRIGVG
ncbi:hypothetical protein AB0D04_31845 [Streptomyces sp. NPDC048483]|uniref:hypothetical protein n=1 Tax=Streptomyces sp. NPDC048483 TaxID=3154927 RepID=UPI00342F28F3